MASRKRKYEQEYRAFNTEWEEEFMFVERNGKPMCLLCQVLLSQFKASNLRRHHDSNHSEFKTKFPIGSELRKTKVKSAKEKLQGERMFMSVFTKESDLTTEAGFALAFNIAKAKKPYTEGEFVKKNMAQIISIIGYKLLDPENEKLQKLVDHLPASRHTMERRISALSGSILNNLQTNIKECSAISLALDESTDIKDTPQLAIFVRYVSKDFEIVEELLDLVALKDTTRGCDVKEALDDVIKKKTQCLSRILSALLPTVHRQ